MQIYEVMMIIRRRCAVTSLAALFIFVLTVNVYFIYVIVDDKTPVPQARESKSSTKPVVDAKLNTKNTVKTVKVQPVKKPVSPRKNATIHASKRIYHRLAQLPSRYHETSLVMSMTLLKELSDDLKSNVEMSTSLWALANSWVGPREIIPESAPRLGAVLRTLCSTKIIKAENANRGTQLKLLLTLEGNQKALFKPEWYSRENIIEGPVYAGKDRHNAEVAAFHVSTLLGLRRSPPTVGRKVNLRREIMAVASDNLLDTFYQEGNNTCFYGVCYYCSPQDPVCAKKDFMEGAVIMWLPDTFKLKKYRNPWQRTYKKDVAARWELDIRYCNKVKALKLYNTATSPRLLDIIDAAIFDFLIDNGDRHHYEVFENYTNSMIVLLDNGKSFGNPKADHLDILAPLYQCCLIRKSTWTRLTLFSGGTLGSSLEALLQHSHISPVLTAPHFKALDRRLFIVYSAVEVCIDAHGKAAVVVSDSYS